MKYRRGATRYTCDHDVYVIVDVFMGVLCHNRKVNQKLLELLGGYYEGIMPQL